MPCTQPDLADLLITCRWWRREARRSVHHAAPPPGLFYSIGLLPKRLDRLKCHAALQVK